VCRDTNLRLIALIIATVPPGVLWNEGCGGRGDLNIDVGLIG